MTVDEMLARISSMELTRWAAYEQVHGPLGSFYSEDKLAGIHELLQAILIALGGQEEGTQVQRQPRPNEVFAFAAKQAKAAKEEQKLTLQEQLERFNQAMDAE